MRNLTAAGETVLCGPSAVLYGAGAEHANVVSAHGFEQIQIEFDPDWLRLDQPRDLDGAHHWIGGEVALAAGALAAIWMNVEASETELTGATSRFLQRALLCEETKTPFWLEHVSGMLAADNPPPTREIASELGLNPRWLCQAYRAAVGEGIGDTVRRRKVEAAAELLRSTTLQPSQIAAEAGFSDQSHMIRCFNAVLRRTPGTIQREWQTPVL
ncbi:MAG TPA: helix-turn-helix transcriptional regulator [Chloroflexota bacterium]|nr:helix-turn-helix transcriptional regulator [Chloroflexota bacterium]